MSERPSILRLVEIWKNKIGVEMKGRGGTEFIGIPMDGQRLKNFKDLFQTMIDLGYSKIEISSPAVLKKIIDECWPDLIVNMTDKDLKISKDIVRRQWTSIVDKFSDVVISQYVEPEKDNIPESDDIDKKSENDKEEILEDIFNPKGRIKIEPFGRVMPALDEELFAKLAAVDKMLKEKKK